jgi:diketogulonate reductase-like aldo/keto reductase
MSEMLTELIQGTVVPKLGLGTFELVGEAAIDTVQKAVETGYRHFDTASKYGNEQAVGEGLSRSGLIPTRSFKLLRHPSPTCKWKMSTYCCSTGHLLTSV